MKQSTAGVIENLNGEILLMKRSTKVTHDPGKWENSGGKVEENETPEQALIRELQEELGVKVTFYDLVYIDKPNDDFEIYVYRVTIAGEPHICEPEMCDEIKWVKKENLKNIDLAEYTRKDFVRLHWI